VSWAIVTITSLVPPFLAYLAILACDASGRVTVPSLILSMPSVRSSGRAVPGFTAPIGTSAAICHLLARLDASASASCLAIGLTAALLSKPTPMQATDTQYTAGIASSPSNPVPDHSSPPLPAPGSHTSITPPVHAVTTAPTNRRPNARQPKSVVWHHFTKAPDYETSWKTTCMHCTKVLTATCGATTTLKTHLEKRHPEKLAESSGR